MDSFAIGVSIMLSSNLPQMLNTISTRMLGLHTTVNQVNNQFGRMATLIGGVGAAFAGVGILKGMGALVEHGAKINHELELMKIQSFEVKEIQESMAQAQAVSAANMTTTVAENLKHIRELRYAFGETQDAIKYSEIVSKANTVVNAFDEKTGAGTKDQVFDLVKAEEMLGLTRNPEAFMNTMDTWVKAMNAAGGKITSANYFGTIKYARSAGLNWDDTFVGQYLPRAMQEYGGGGGGGGPGNALQSAYQAVIGGKMTKTAGDEFDRMGLARAEHIKGSTASHITGMKGADLFIKNPYEWVQTVFMPALSEHGITGEAVGQQITKMFSNRVAADIMMKFGTQGRFALGEQSPWEKDARLAREAQGILPSFNELMSGDWQTNIKAFNAQWENLLQNLGSPAVRTATEMLSGINGVISGISQAVGEHPDAARVFVEAAAVLGAAAVVGGMVAVFAAIAGLAPVAGSIAALGTALAGLAAINWNAFKGMGNFGGPGTVPGQEPTYDPMTGAPLSGPPKPGKQSFNVVPPSGSDRVINLTSITSLDGRVLAKSVTRYQSDAMGGTIQGSPYPDHTRLQPASDLAYA